MAKRKDPKRSRSALYTPTDQVDLIELAQERFNQARDADTDQRQRELDDLQFYAGEQWPQDIKDSRAGTPGNAASGVPPVPARPSLTINKVREPVRQVLNEERDAELGVEIAAADDFGAQTAGISPQEIELREGLVRRIQRESHASDARSWAFARATIAGRGFYGVRTRYAEGRSFDQDVYVERFYNQASVSLDPNHEQPDGSDAEWAFVGADLPWDKYQADYGTVGDDPNTLTQLSAQDFRALGDELPGWFTTTGKTRSVRVVEYWYTERTTETICQLVDGRVVVKDETITPEMVALDSDEEPLERSYTKKAIKWAKLDGVQILEETDWPGQYIPIIKVVGEELQPFDGQRRSEGMVRPARDSQRSYNYMVSKWVEQIGLAPIPPWMLAAGQDEGFEQEYALSTTRTLPALHYNPKALDGTMPGPPFRTNVTTEIAAIAGSVQLFDQAIKSTTAIPDPTLGNIDPSLKSGKAIRQVLEQATKGTSHYLNNLARSIRYEGQIINDLLYPIYNRPGRLARLMTPQGETRPVLVGQPFVPHPETKAPMAQMGGQPVTSTMPGAQVYTLTPDASFNVTVKVTKNFDTRREEQESTLAQLIQAEPQLMGVFGDLLFKYNDGPGHDELEERAKTMLVPPVQALISGQPQQNPQVQQLQQQVQQLTQMVQTKQAEKQLEGQFDLQKAQMDNETKIKIALIQATASTSNAQAKIDAEDARTFIDAMENRLGKALELHMARLGQVHEAMNQASGQAHDAALAAQGHQHELEQAAQEHQQALAQGQQGHAQALEQGQQAAALAPPPAQGA